MAHTTQKRTRTTTLTERFSEGVIESGWLAALAVTPLLFNPYAKQNFEVAKVFALRSIVIVMIAAWLIKVLSGGRLSRRGRGGAIDSGSEKSRFSTRALAVLKVPLVLPALAICVSYILSTVLSVAPGLSFWGSYARLEGVPTHLAYVALFALVLMHLRTSAQWRRITYVVIVCSVPVALYALIQRLGIDPITWPDVDVRVGSTLGNPIFLGAYLIMVFFITLKESVERVQMWRATPAGAVPLRRSRLVHAVLLAGAVSLQLAALLFSQSRGPMLGLIAGCLVLFPTAWFLFRKAKADHDSPRAWSRIPRRLRNFGLVLGGLAIVASATVARPQLAKVATRTGLARIASPLSFNSLTAQTRMLIWRGAVNVIKADKPLRPAHGEPDPRHQIRPLIGYGPETFGLALNRHLASKLVKWEQGENTPDRAHNRVLEQLVTTGFIGFVAWAALYSAVFFYAGSWLGLLPTRGRRIIFAATIAAGGALGAFMPVFLFENAAVSAAGMVAAVLLGLVGFFVVTSFFERRRRSAPEKTLASPESLILCVLAAIVANLVETQFGINLAVTSVYLWFLLAVLVVTGLGWLRDEEPSQVPVESKGTGFKKGGTWLPGALIAAPSICLVYGFLSNWNNENSTLDLVKAILVPDTQTAAIRIGLWTIGWLVAMLLAFLLLPLDTSRKASIFNFKTAIASLCVPGIYLVWQCARLTWTIRARASGAAVETISMHIADHYSFAVWSLLVAVFASGWVLALRSGVRVAATRAQLFRTAVAAVVIGVAAMGLINRANLDPVRADTLLKHGEAAVNAGRTQLGLDLIRKAASFAPYEPLYPLHEGRAFMAAARPGEKTISVRRTRLLEAERSLKDARALSPLDPDHSANIARCLIVQSTLATSPGAREDLQRRAAAEYAETLRLRPTWPRVIEEYEGLLRSMGRTDEADTLNRRLERIR